MNGILYHVMYNNDNKAETILSCLHEFHGKCMRLENPVHLKDTFHVNPVASQRLYSVCLNHKTCYLLTMAGCVHLRVKTLINVGISL